MAWELCPLASPGDAAFSHLKMCDSSQQLKEPRCQREAWAPDTCGERGMSTSGVECKGPEVVSAGSGGVEALGAQPT